MLTAAPRFAAVDYEDVRALDLQLLSERVHALLRGEAVPERRFDFLAHRGDDLPSQMLQMEPDRFVILEGIHGLNPTFTGSLGDDMVFKVCVSAVTHLNVDGT